MVHQGPIRFDQWLRAKDLQGTPRVVLQLPPGKCLIWLWILTLQRRPFKGRLRALWPGNHTIKHSSSLQCAISLSSDEAEFYSVVKTTSLGIWLQELFRHVDMKIKLFTDSSAALGTANRCGLGKPRSDYGDRLRTLWHQCGWIRGQAKRRTVGNQRRFQFFGELVIWVCAKIR